MATQPRNRGAIDSINHFLGLVIKLLATALAGLVALGFIGYFVYWRSDVVRGETFDACQARVLEHSLDQKRGAEFSDRCMSAAGYFHKSLCDPQFYPVAYCYAPRWMFWKE